VTFYKVHIAAKVRIADIKWLLYWWEIMIKVKTTLCLVRSILYIVGIVRQSQRRLDYFGLGFIFGLSVYLFFWL
jgi:hypothetical protein